MMHTSDDVLADLFSFISGSPSPFHAVDSAAAALESHGFSALDEAQRWDDPSGRHFVKRSGALIAWVRSPDASPATPVRLIGAHTDSPNLRLKPQPDSGRAGYRQLGVEVYGGPLLNSWLDRDLGIAGRLMVDGGHQVLVRIDEPVARVAQLAIHLDREVNEGLRLDRQLHLSPIWGLGSATDGELIEFVAAQAQVRPAQVDGFDLMLHDVAPPAVLGADRSMYAAARIDNLASCHGAIAALASAADAAQWAMICLFDHEEVGSGSSTGADGSMLAHILERIEMGVGGDRETLLRSIAQSWCVSADGAHAVHPNYLDRYEPDHLVSLNGGPVVKTNVNERYATSAEGMAMFKRVCEVAEVPHQVYSHRTNLACGSTIGPLTAANLGVRTVDVGSAQLSMHSARELGGVEDPAMLAAALAAFAAGG
ncbi:MAG: M18 family aminopeptidase [Acidimicrobiales bacterium]|nr:M18 family aminopeptidase [Acidimicrobiales bacterium]